VGGGAEREKRQTRDYECRQDRAKSAAVHVVPFPESCVYG
jgi:hypothetical protein